MKKRLIIFLVLIICLSVTGCGPSIDSGIEQGGGNENKTTISVHIVNGGTGSQWLKDASNRFQLAYENEVFEPGKKGVYIDITANQEAVIPTMATSGTNIYFFLGHYDILTLAQKGDFILNINDIINEKYDIVNDQKLSILDKIYDTDKESIKGADGNYYGLPYCSTATGLTYDVELFNKYNLYLAAPEESNVTTVNNKYGSINLVKNATGKKSCGNDGKYGTDDDGLPTSLQEMLILFSHMKNTYSISPLTMSGAYTAYANYLVCELWTTLAGYDQQKALYTFDSQGIDVVDGYTEENLFMGIDYIKKPKTRNVPVTEATGYLLYDSVYRYYAQAFVEACYREGFFSKDAITTSVEHLPAQEDFVNNGIGAIPKMAMIIEGNWWYNEAEEKQQIFTNYYNNFAKTKGDFKWVSLPTSVNQTAQPVADDQPARRPVSSGGAGYMVVNHNISGNTALIGAIKKYVQFLYSDIELQNYTLATNMIRGQFKYELGDENYAKLSTYGKSVYNFCKSAQMIPFANNKTYLNGRETFAMHQNMPVLTPTFGGVKYSSCFSAYKTGGKTTKEVFEATRINEETWLNVYYNKVN